MAYLMFLVFLCVVTFTVGQNYTAMNEELEELKKTTESIRNNYTRLHADLKQLEEKCLKRTSRRKVQIANGNNSSVIDQFDLEDSYRPVVFSGAVDTDIYDLQEHHTIAFTRQLENTHNSYNNVSGVFTAPRSGNYAFFVTILVYPGVELYYQIMKSGNFGSGNGYSFGPSEHNAYGSGSTSGVIYLNTGDQVYVEVNSVSGSGAIVKKYNSHFLGFSLN